MPLLICILHRLYIGQAFLETSIVQDVGHGYYKLEVTYKFNRLGRPQAIAANITRFDDENFVRMCIFVPVEQRYN